MLYVRLIVLVRLSNIYWFHPLKCEDLLLFVIKLRLFVIALFERAFS